MEFFVRPISRVVALCWLLGCLPASAQTKEFPGRVTAGDTLFARLYNGEDRGSLPPATIIRGVTMVLQPSASRVAALRALVADQQNPHSLRYHDWLTPTRFGEQFGVAEEDADKVVEWLASQGLQDIYLSHGRTFITFSGSAAAMESAFQTEIHTFVVHGRRHFANVTAPSIPASLAAVRAVTGLHDFNPVSQLISAESQYTSGNAGNSLGPGDLAVLYDIQPLLNQGVDGRGVSIALLGQTPIGPDDYLAYRDLFSLPENGLEIVEVPGSGTGTGVSDDEEEAALDVEEAGAVARGAHLLYVWGSTIEVAALYTIDNHLADVMSLSYAGCETPGNEFYETLALQANAEGITWVSAAGDSGAAGCDPSGSAGASGGLHAMVPASAPEITAVGGTALADGSSSQYWSPANNSLDATALSYIPETGWSNSSAVYGGGGGVSRIFARPDYQSDLDPSAANGRLLPDVSLAAAPAPVPYLIVYQGTKTLVGGTSAAAPVFAGMVALANQYLTERGDLAAPGLGNVNPVLYRLARQEPDAFRDIAGGSNDVPCATGSPDCGDGILGYPARPGYDEATGLGSVDAYALVSNWPDAAIDSSMTGTITSLSASPAQITLGQPLTLVVQVAATAGSEIPLGTVTIYAGAAPLTTIALDPSGKASYTYIPSLAGTAAYTAGYPGSPSFQPSSAAPLNVLVSAPAPDFSLTAASNISMAAGSSAALQLSIAPMNGFNGLVQLTCTGLPKWISCNLSTQISGAAPANLTVTLAATASGSAAILLGLFVFFPFGGKTARNRRRGLMVAVLAVVVMSTSGCVGGTISTGSSPRPAQNYLITITAASGAIQHQVTVNLSVTGLPN
jgi:subtilase family serine protease